MKRMPIKDESHFCRVLIRTLAALTIALSIQACGSDGDEMTEVESGLAPESVVLSTEQQENLDVLQSQQERAFSAYAFPSGNVKAEFKDLILQKADAAASKLMATSDVNGDGNADVVWTNSFNETVVSTIRSTSVIGCYKLGAITDTLMGSGDFNGDGKADLVWRNMSTGAVRISLMNGGTVTQWLNVGQSPIALNTKLEGIGDFDGNGRADMLWRNQTTGRSVMSYHNTDGSVASWPEVSKFINPSSTTALKVGDINGDGKDDIVWRNMSTGNVVISLMNGNVPTWKSITTSPIAPSVRLEAIGDFDNNGKADLLWRNTVTGRSLMSYHNADGSVASWPVVSNFINPVNTSAVGVGDFDGDGKSDIFWRNLTTGNSVMSLMKGNVPNWQAASFSDCPSAESTTLKGRFIDAPVAGLKYQSTFRGGVTDSQGYFNYDSPGEPITFSIGNLSLGTARATADVHVYSLEGSAVEMANNKNGQVAQLLQSLDMNKGTGSVIQLPADIHTKMTQAGSLSLGGSQAQFELNLEQYLNGNYPMLTKVPLGTAQTNAGNQLAPTNATCPIAVPTAIQQYGSSTQIPLGNLTCADRARMQYYRSLVKPRLTNMMAEKQDGAAVVEESWSPEAAERAIDVNPILTGLQSLDVFDYLNEEGRKAAIVLATKSAQLVIDSTKSLVTAYLQDNNRSIDDQVKAQKILELTNRIVDVISNGAKCVDAFSAKTKDFTPCATEVVSLLESYKAYYDMKPISEKAIADKLDALANAISALVGISELGGLEGGKASRQGFAIANKIVQSASNVVAVAYYNNHGNVPLQGPAYVATTALDNLVSPMLTIGEQCYGGGKNPLQRLKCVNTITIEGGKLAIRGAFNGVGTVLSIKYVGQSNSVIVATEVLDELLSAGAMGEANTYTRFASHGAIQNYSSDAFQQREKLKSLVQAVGQKTMGFTPVDGWTAWGQAIATMTLGNLQFNVTETLNIVQDELTDIKINANVNFQSAALEMTASNTALGQTTLNLTVRPQNSGLTAGNVQCYSLDATNYSKLAPWSSAVSANGNYQVVFNFNKSTVTSLYCALYNQANVFKGSNSVVVNTSAPPTISAVNPTSAVLNTPTVFTVTGTNLPPTAILAVADATCLGPVNNPVAGAGFSQTCTPLAIGTKTITVKTASGASGGTVIDNSRSVTVTAIPTLTVSLLTDTGITANQCLSTGFALIPCNSTEAINLSNTQDGMVGRDVNTPNNTDGKLGFSYSTVGSYQKTDCVKDNVTGLIWEGKPTSGSRANNLTFTNLGNHATNDASSYVAMVNSGTGLCGYTDWRLPTFNELQSIVDYGVAYPITTVDSTWLPNTVGDIYWVSSSYLSYLDAAWSIDFKRGDVDGSYRDYSYYVRLVRGIVTSPQYTYSVGGSEVFDSATGLTWRRCAEGMVWSGSGCTGAALSFYHGDALYHAKTEATSSGKPWRVPNVKELTSITKLGIAINPSIDVAAFPATPSSIFITSTPAFIGSSGGIFGVNFNNGGLSNYYGSLHVRLVR